MENIEVKTYRKYEEEREGFYHTEEWIYFPNNFFPLFIAGNCQRSIGEN